MPGFQVLVQSYLRLIEAPAHTHIHEIMGRSQRYAHAQLERGMLLYTRGLPEIHDAC